MGTESAQAAIATDKLTKVFGANRAVDALTVSVGRGEIFGLVGPDGAGKTTTMRMLAAILEPTSGEAWVDGLHVIRDAEPIKDRIGYMSQRFGLYPDLTVMENIEFYAELYGVPPAGRADKVERLLAFSNLGPFKRRSAGNLSGGMKQKLGLVCALIHTPRVLLLDEPTNGVDPVSRRDFWRILYQLHKESVTIFVSTAYLDEAERCGRVGLMHRGRLLACSSPAEMRGLVHGALLEVRCANARRAAPVLREARLGSVALFGERLHVLAPDESAGRSAIERVLRGAGFACGDIALVEPSLEDVFMATVSEEAARG